MRCARWKTEDWRRSLEMRRFVFGYNFYILELKEKILSGDKTLTIKLTEMEAKYKKEINELNKQIEELKNEPIIFAVHPNSYGINIKYSPNCVG